jgi:uncharacterized protein (DUF433 family)
MTTEYKIKPKLGEGVYLPKDIATILNLDYQKVYRWIAGYWKGGLNDKFDYTFGDDRAINFFSLIEFYTFFKLRERGVSVNELKKLHGTLEEKLNTKYPFAMATDFYVEKKSKYKKFVYFNYLGSLMKFHPKNQFKFDFFKDFLDKIEFNDEGLAIKYFPLGTEKSIVVDPKFQFGQPIISGKNVRTEVIYKFHLGGESDESICNLYNLNMAEVKDAISFHLKAA